MATRADRDMGIGGVGGVGRGDRSGLEVLSVKVGHGRCFDCGRNANNDVHWSPCKLVVTIHCSICDVKCVLPSIRMKR